MRAEMLSIEKENDNEEMGLDHGTGGGCGVRGRLFGRLCFAQEPGNTTTPGVNWTAMYDYCRNVLTGNTSPAVNDFVGMGSYCQNASATGNFSPDGMMGNGGMMGGRGEMMGNRSVGRSMMGW